MSRIVVRFLALGALLLAAERVWLAPAPVIEIEAQRIERLARDHAARFGRAPDAAERRALLDGEIDDELLLREALARGLDRDDPVVQVRLVRNLRFLRGGEAGDAATLLREARALGLEQSDTVVRRRLIQRMRFALEAAADPAEPEDAELRAFRSRHAERFSAPPRVRIAQAPWGASVPVPAPRPDGPLLSQRELEKRFGPGFARAAFAAPLRAWTGPVASSHGRHRLYVHERVSGGPIPLDAVRARLRGAVLEERRARALREGLAALRASYRIVLPAGLRPSPPGSARP